MNWKKTGLLLLLLFAFTNAGFTQIFKIPGVGEVGFERKGLSNFIVSLAKYGTYEFLGYFKSKKDFDLSVTIPVGVFAEKIPKVGKILVALGLDSATIRLIPTGMVLTIHLENGGLGFLRGDITETLSKIKVIKVVINKIISQLEINYIDLIGTVTKETLKGRVTGEISVIGKKFPFNVEGEISTKKILNAIVNKVVPVVKEFAVEQAKAAFNKTKELAITVGTKAKEIAKKVYAEAAEMARTLATTVTHGKHTFDRCYNNCVPDYANSQRNKMLGGGNAMYQEFYNSVYPDLVKVEGETPEETAKMRFSIIGEQWNALTAQMDSQWQSIYDDSEVRKYFWKNASKDQGLEKYRSMIMESWNEQKAFRDGLFNKLLTYLEPVRIKKTPAQALSDLAMYSKFATPIQIMVSTEDYAWVIADPNSTNNGNPVQFWSKLAHPAQYWYLREVGTNAYSIQNAASGKYIHISGAIDQKGQPMTTWDGANAQARQTVFHASANDDGMIFWTTDAGWAFDLEGGVPGNGKRLILWDLHRGANQAFYIVPILK